MADSFQYDVFLSHSSKDKPVVRELAARLKKDGVHVWLDEEQIKPDDSLSPGERARVRASKIEEGLEHSRVLVLCMSANAFGSEWAQLESGTFRFRDPLNKERRFILLRLDGAPIKGYLAQFLCVDWRSKGRNLHGNSAKGTLARLFSSGWGAGRKQEYAKLLEACRLPKPKTVKRHRVREISAEKIVHLDLKEGVWAFAFSQDAKRVLSGFADNALQVWSVETGICQARIEGLTRDVWGLAWSSDHSHVLSGSDERTVQFWDIVSGKCISTLAGHTDRVSGVTFSVDQRRALSCSFDRTVRMWDLDSGNCLAVLEGHAGHVIGLAWCNDQRYALSGSTDKTLRLWDLEMRRCTRIFEGHTGDILRVAWSWDQRYALSGSRDKTIRLWDTQTGRCLSVIEGHDGEITCIAWNRDRRFALSGSEDRSVRLWDLETNRCLCVLSGHPSIVRSVAWRANQRHCVSADMSGSIRVWDLSEFLEESRKQPIPTNALFSTPAQIQYTNAKVLLVGETGSGKTGLSMRLASDIWEPSDSTVGAWATQWKLPVALGKEVEREIWLWDFGGQADQRLIHQLYMDETALAVLVFDGQKEDLFETLGQWDRDLTRATRQEFAKLLVAGRVDAGGLRASRSELAKFSAERKFLVFLETSAKKNLGCEELKQAILAGINWDELPCRTTSVLFKALKSEIIWLKDKGCVLMRFNELRESLQLRLSGKFEQFSDEELRAVLTLLAGPGVVWELAFGSWVLLQPERINAYAQAVIRTLQADEYQRGCLMEDRVLSGDLQYESTMPRLAADEEQFVLLAMHQTLVERGLCLRQPTEKGNLLVFPSYYRRERPDIVQHPAVLVNYRFTGFLDEIYATLIVRLHHTETFEQDQLWRYAADFKTNTGKQLGVKLVRRAPGAGDLELYFDPAVAVEEKIIFSKYVHEHLLQHARDVERLRHYICPQCGTPVGNREVAMKRLQTWLHENPVEAGVSSVVRLWTGKSRKPTIVCSECEERVSLWDEMEQCFASPEIQRRVRDLQNAAAIVLDNESKERALVGEVISTVALAGQISRELTVSDHGIDMEIEFKDDEGRATGKKLYLQLKCGDSYLRKRGKDGPETFVIQKERHVAYWMNQQFPVMLLIREFAVNEVRWMEIRDYLKRESANGEKPVKKIVFVGERFDVMSVRRWREKLLA